MKKLICFAILSLVNVNSKKLKFKKLETEGNPSMDFTGIFSNLQNFGSVKTGSVGVNKSTADIQGFFNSFPNQTKAFPNTQVTSFLPSQTVSTLPVQIGKEVIVNDPPIVLSKGVVTLPPPVLVNKGVDTALLPVVVSKGVVTLPPPVPCDKGVEVATTFVQDSYVPYIGGKMIKGKSGNPYNDGVNETFLPVNQVATVDLQPTRIRDDPHDDHPSPRTSDIGAGIGHDDPHDDHHSLRTSDIGHDDPHRNNGIRNTDGEDRGEEPGDDLGEEDGEPISLKFFD